MMQAQLGWEDAHGDNKATWDAHAARSLGPNIRESALLKELARWLWDVVRVLVDHWEAPRQDAEDAYASYLLDVARALAGRDVSKHTTKDRVLAAPKGEKWLPSLVYRAKNRQRRQRENHDSVSPTDFVGASSNSVALLDHRTPPPWAALEQREELDELLALLRRALAGRRGSDLQFRVVAGRLVGLDYAEISTRVHRSAASCRVAYTKALKRLSPRLRDRLAERSSHAA